MSSALGFEAKYRALAGFIPFVETGIESYVRQGEPTPLRDAADEVDVPAMALIAVRTVLNHLTYGHSTIARLGGAIGAAVEMEARARRLKRDKPHLYNTVFRMVGPSPRERRRMAWRAIMSDRDDCRWPATKRAAIGHVLLDIVRERTSICNLQRVAMNGAKRGYLVFSEPFVAWFERQARRMPLDRKPSLSPPMDHAADAIDRLVRTKSKEQAAAIRNAAMPEVIAATNAIQRTGWRINEGVLGLLSMLTANGSMMAGLPQREDLAIPPRPEGRAQRKDWRHVTAELVMHNMKHRAMRVRLVRMLATARGLVGKTFYFPCHLDFRGRLYPDIQFLTFQGDTFARALLEFAEGEPIDSQAAEDALAIHGANVFGLDKKSDEERIRFVHEHETAIRRVAEAPFEECRDFWSKCDKPFEFYAFCQEWSRYRGSTGSFVSRLACRIDATGNVLQIAASLLGDRPLAVSANLGSVCQRGDPYAVFSESLSQALRNSPDDLLRRWSRWFGQEGAPRSLAKPPLMAFPQGLSLFGLRCWAQRWYREECRERGGDPWNHDNRARAVFRLTNTIWSELHFGYERLRKLMLWFEGVGREARKLKVALAWTTPTGFMVQSDYHANRRRKIRTKAFRSVRVRRSVAEEAQLPPDRKQTKALVANYIQSTDASVMARAIAKLESLGHRSLASVHDAFVAPARRIPEVKRVVVESFVDVMRGDPLAEFRRQIPFATEEPPARGDFNVETAIGSRYAWT